MTNLSDLIERVEAGQVKALSIKQPYPHYILHKGKDVENRDWPTRGADGSSSTPGSARPNWI